MSYTSGRHGDSKCKGGFQGSRGREGLDKTIVKSFGPDSQQIYTRKTGDAGRTLDADAFLDVKKVRNRQSWAARGATCWHTDDTIISQRSPCPERVCPQFKPASVSSLPPSLLQPDRRDPAKR